tara:strand:- start:1959 stop:2321 length:363 start_codon:yes stop_codon:yes gene_type:complete
MNIKRELWLILGSVWSCIIIFLSLISPSSLPDVLFRLEDFIMHFIAYLFASFLFTMGSRSSFGPWKPALLCFLLGSILEIIQPMMLNGRSFSYQDMISNTLGLIFGIILARLLGKRIFTS